MTTQTEQARTDIPAGFSHTFTVFTPTYNRAHTLHRVYESLRAQTYRDFEWLIVDDASQDNTADLVRGWEAEADFPIRYVVQVHGGKHMAFNRAVREARGYLFLTLDSDHACVPEALERFKHHWESIPSSLREGFSAVTGLCRDNHGSLVGQRFPMDPTDSDSLEIHYRYKVAGEKWGFHRTDVLREFPFPDGIEGNFIPEALVWHQIARKYKTRFVNEELRVYWVEGPSLLRRQKSGHNAGARRVYHRFVLNTEMDWFRYDPVAFAKSAAQFGRLSLHDGVGLAGQFRELQGFRGRTLWLASLPLAGALFLMDRRRDG